MFLICSAGLKNTRDSGTSQLSAPKKILSFHSLFLPFHPIYSFLAVRFCPNKVQSPSQLTGFFRPVARWTNINHYRLEKILTSCMFNINIEILILIQQLKFLKPGMCIQIDFIRIWIHKIYSISDPGQSNQTIF